MGSTGKAFGGFRTQHGSPINVALSLASRPFFEARAERIDFRPVLEGEVFVALQDLKLFNAVVLDPTVGTLTWPNGADFDPETLHDWSKYREELTAMARRWVTKSKSAQRSAG